MKKFFKQTNIKIKNFKINSVEEKNFTTKEFNNLFGD